jgi:hypothetical protein
MTETQQIADVVVAAVRAASAQLLERIAVLEARAPVPGPMGERGPVGERGLSGEKGDAGPTGRDAVLPVSELALMPDDIVTGLREALRRECTTFVKGTV